VFECRSEPYSRRVTDGRLKRKVLLASMLVSVACLSACGGESTPEVTPSPEGSASEPATTASESAEPTEPEPTEEATTEEPDTTGTRETPLAIGETRLLAEGSAWTVGMTASSIDAADAILSADQYAERPAEGEVFVLGTVTITVGEESLVAQGHDLQSAGVTPGIELNVEFVGSNGNSYNGSSGTTCYTESMLYMTGAVYTDGATVTGDVCVAVPAEAAEGGLWRISNVSNDAVWVQSS
jgi:hypothetical protein